MKPVCKAEAMWVYWRIENPKNHRDKFSQWEKKQMARARRQYFRKEIKMKQSRIKEMLEQSINTLTNAEKERLQAAEIEASKGIQPCGHPKSSIVSDEEGTCYCGECEKEEKDGINRKL